jgi:hypothetical protein
MKYGPHLDVEAENGSWSGLILAQSMAARSYSDILREEATRAKVSVFLGNWSSEALIDTDKKAPLYRVVSRAVCIPPDKE